MKIFNYFGFDSPSVFVTVGFSSARGDGDVGRSLSTEKSALSNSGLFLPPPLALRAQDRSEAIK